MKEFSHHMTGVWEIEMLNHGPVSVTSILFLNMFWFRAFGVRFWVLPRGCLLQWSYIGLCLPVCWNMWPVVACVTWETEVFLGGHTFSRFLLCRVLLTIRYETPGVIFFGLLGRGLSVSLWFDSAVSVLSPWWLAPGTRRPQCHWNSTSKRSATVPAV